MRCDSELLAKSMIDAMPSLSVIVIEVINITDTSIMPSFEERDLVRCGAVGAVLIEANTVR